MGIFQVVSLSLALLLSGCASIPDSYAPPMQRNPQTAPEPKAAGHFLSMADPNAEAYIVRDIDPAGENKSWRWTRQRPEMRFILSVTDGLRFVMDFAVPEMTFAQRGPVAISIFINGHLLDKVICEKGGERHFEKPVPAAWLRTDVANRVAAEIDKLWTAPADGAKLGFILSRAGFVQ